MKITDLLFPPKCIACSELLVNPEQKLCKECLEYWKSAELKRCCICGKTARNCDCRPRHISSTDKIGERHISSLVFFGRADSEATGDKLTRTLIYDLKRKQSTSLAEFFAIKLSHLIIKLLTENGQSTDSYVLTYPPRSGVGIKKEGFDHMKYLVAYVSRYTGIPVEEPLKNSSKVQQKLLNVFGRLENSKRAYSIKKGKSVQPLNYILIDDVITTGATVEAVTKLLKENGAASVYPLCIAKPRYRRRNKIQGRLYWKKVQHS